MTNQRPPRGDRAHPAEPEILPPLRGDRRRAAVWPQAFIEERGRQQIYVARIGPLGLVLLSLLVAMMAVAGVVLFLGAMLIWIPVVGVLAAVAIVASLLRSYIRRLR